MGDRTTISWTGATWNPIRGCTVVSPGCTHCYAMKIAARFSGPGQPYEGLAHVVNGNAVWTGRVMFVDKHLDDPLRWRKPRRIFVNSMSDLFHEGVPDEWLDRIFDVMEKADHHIFQILTKRPERMRDYIVDRTARKAAKCVSEQGWPLPEAIFRATLEATPPHVWFGVSVEDQARADERIPILLKTPAVVRFLSCEPLLGRVDLDPYLWRRCDGCEGSMSVPVDGGGMPCPDCINHQGSLRTGLHWVIVGGESGPKHRPMELWWAERIQEECDVARVPFFFKQTSGPQSGMGVEALGRVYHEFPVVAS